MSTELDSVTLAESEKAPEALDYDVLVRENMYIADEQHGNYDSNNITFNLTAI